MIAIPLHQSRVAPVLDWCSTILLIPKKAGKSWHDGEQLTIKTNVFDLLRLLHSKDVSPVICGALSPHALRYGQHLGLEFICGISGAIDEVVEAYRAGELDQPRFRLPGCRCKGRPRPSTGPSPTHHGSEQGGIVMPGNRGKGGPMGRQQGQGRGRGSAGRGTGSAMGVAVCVCPQCGGEAPHSRGMPCTQTVCQECGTPLVRKSPAPGSSM
jgi:predicted Fe-Mo cluster-binding NifX family protein